MDFDQPKYKDLVSALAVTDGSKFSLSSHPTRDETFFEDKRAAIASAAQDAQVIDHWQDRLYAEGRRALLVVLQGIDTAGKSGTIRSVFRATSPLGMTVKAFKKPTPEELARDYLWRAHNAIPAKGYIGIFDRSHYEDVLVVKVRELAPKKDVAKRYSQINGFEKHLTQNGVEILKFFLNISYEEQGERLRDRLSKPHKRWKFNPGDLEDRELWDDFSDAYETMVQKCSTKWAPWYVIPSDSKSRRNALIARIVRHKLESMKPDYPDPGYRLEHYEI